MLESLGNLAGAEFLPVRAFLGFFCKISTPAEPGTSGLEKTAPSGELEFSSRSN